MSASKRERIRLGIIGAGDITMRHMANLEFLGGNDVAAIADTRLEAARERAAPVSANAYADWKEMLKQESDIDAVLLCTPPVLRKEVFAAAADAGIAVFCEKPPAQNLAEAKEIADIVHQSGMVCSVGFNCRYAASVDECRRLLASRTVNVVRAAVLNPIALPGRRALGEWFYLKERGGGLFDVLIHTLDLIRCVAGNVESVQAFGSNVVVPKDETFTIEDTISMNMRLASGGSASVVTSWACGHGLSDLTFFGEDFQIGLTPIPPRLRGRVGAPEAESVDRDFPQGPAMGRGGKINPKRKPEDPPDPPHCEEMKVFLEAVRTGDTSGIRSPYADAAETVALVDAICRSMESGRVEPASASA